MFLLIIFSVAEELPRIEKIIEEVRELLLDYPVGILVDDRNQLILVNDWGITDFFLGWTIQKQPD